MSFFDVLGWLSMCAYASSVANSVNHFITCVCEPLNRFCVAHQLLVVLELLLFIFRHSL